MKKILLLFCLFSLAFSENCVAQNILPATETKPDLYRNSIYIELGGNAESLSLNYERLLPLAKPGNTLALRIGGVVGPNGRIGRTMGYEFYLPLEASVLMGKRAVKLELGMGVTFWGYGRRGFNNSGQPEKYDYLEAVPVLRVGGRWQIPGKHWFVRVGFTPFLQENYTAIKYPFSPWAGISVGYNFGRN